ncbi:hypothetical protein Tco_0916140 [Tanacetum coccineum]
MKVARVHDQTRIIKKSHHGMGQDGMHSLEACVHGSHRVGNQLHVRGMDRSGGRALGCLGWTGIGIRGRCGYTSSWLAPPAAPPNIKLLPTFILLVHSPCLMNLPIALAHVLVHFSGTSSPHVLPRRPLLRFHPP